MQYSRNLYGRLTIVLMCSKAYISKMLSYIAIFGGTHLYEPDCWSQSMRLGWSLVSSWIGQECDLYAPPEGSAFGSLVLVRHVVKLLYAKLAIQGIVHCSVMKKSNPVALGGSSTYQSPLKFLIYQTLCGNIVWNSWQTYVPRDLVGDCWIMDGLRPI